MIDVFSDNPIFNKIINKIFYFVFISLCYGVVIYALRKNNNFYGLNESSDILDCIYYSTIVFTGSGYGEIHPQTPIGRYIILSLTFVKLFIIVYPIESISGERFTVENNEISLEDVMSVVRDIDRMNNSQITKGDTGLIRYTESPDK